jgi:drug/metabolite transporter (DMT)-like permease
MSVRAAAPALAAALLFGASTPVAKLLVGQVPPLLLAGLLYLGSGLGLGALLLWRRTRETEAAAALQVPAAAWPWLLGAIVFGGVLGPALLMWGLTRTGAASASLLLNLEGVLTAVLVPLGQMKRHPHGHQRAGQQQRQRDRIAQQRHGQ